MEIINSHVVTGGKSNDIHKHCLRQGWGKRRSWMEGLGEVMTIIAPPHEIPPCMNEHIMLPLKTNVGAL